VTERLAYGQCRRCAADTVDSTYRCAHCGSDDVELFHMPVVYGTSSTTDTAAFDGDEPAHDPAAAPNTRDVHHDHSAIMLPAAVVLALGGCIACMVGAHQDGGEGVWVSLIILGVTGGPFVLFALGDLARRGNEQAFASTAAVIGVVMSLGVAMISGLAGSLFTSGGATSAIVSVSPLLFVLAALAGGIAAAHRGEPR
jgi:hypothetical protein